MYGVWRGVHPPSRNFKNPAGREGRREREDEGRSVRLPLLKFKANGKGKIPGQQKVPTIQWSLCREVERWGAYILPQFQEPVGGAREKVRGVHAHTWNFKTNSNGNNRGVCPWWCRGFEIGHLVFESTALLREMAFSSRNPGRAINFFCLFSGRLRHLATFCSGRVAAEVDAPAMVRGSSTGKMSQQSPKRQLPPQLGQKKKSPMPYPSWENVRRCIVHTGLGFWHAISPNKAADSDTRCPISKSPASRMGRHISRNGGSNLEDRRGTPQRHHLFARPQFDNEQASGYCCEAPCSNRSQHA